MPNYRADQVSGRGFAAGMSLTACRPHSLRGGRNSSVIGLISGAGLVPLYIGYLNRDGPGEVCSTRRPGATTASASGAPGHGSWPGRCSSSEVRCSARSCGARPRHRDRVSPSARGAAAALGAARLRHRIGDEPAPGGIAGKTVQPPPRGFEKRQPPPGAPANGGARRRSLRQRGSVLVKDLATAPLGFTGRLATAGRLAAASGAAGAASCAAARRTSAAAELGGIAEPAG